MTTCAYSKVNLIGGAHVACAMCDTPYRSAREATLDAPHHLTQCKGVLRPKGSNPSRNDYFEIHAPHRRYQKLGGRVMNNQVIAKGDWGTLRSLGPLVTDKEAPSRNYPVNPTPFELSLMVNETSYAMNGDNMPVEFLGDSYPTQFDSSYDIRSVYSLRGDSIPEIMIKDGDRVKAVLKVPGESYEVDGEYLMQDYESEGFFAEFAKQSLGDADSAFRIMSNGNMLRVWLKDGKVYGLDFYDGKYVDINALHRIMPSKDPSVLRMASRIAAIHVYHGASNQEKRALNATLQRNAPFPSVERPIGASKTTYLLEILRMSAPKREIVEKAKRDRAQLDDVREAYENASGRLKKTAAKLRKKQVEARVRRLEDAISEFLRAYPDCDVDSRRSLEEALEVLR